MSEPSSGTGGGIVALKPPLRALVAGFVVALATLYAISPGNFSDPYVFFDDYPFLFDWRSIYWANTLSEGRWLNYAWLYVVGPVGPHVAYIFVIASWCAIAAIMAASVFRADRIPWRAALLAVAFAVAPPFAFLVAWSNTFVPINLVLLIYVAIAGWARPNIAAWSLLVFVPLGFMTYPTSPMIMVLALALCGDWRGIGPSARLVVLLVAGIAIGLLAIYSLNWFAHGVFGIVEAKWRGGNGVQDVSDVARNAGAGAKRVQSALFFLLHPERLVGVVTILAAPFVAYAYAPRRALPVLAVTAAGIGFLIAIYLATGAPTSLRACAFVWLGLAALYALAASGSSRTSANVIGVAALLLLAIGGAWYWRTLLQTFSSYQTETAEIAARVETPGQPPAPILVYSAADSNSPRGELNANWSLAFRLTQLTGVEACICGAPRKFKVTGNCEPDPTRALCEANAQAAAELPKASSGAAVGTGPDGATLLRVPH